MAIEYHSLYDVISQDMKLPAPALRLYLLMLSLSNINNGEVLPIYVRDIAAKYERKERTTQKWLAVLVREGLVDRIFHKHKCNDKWNDRSSFIVHGKDAKRYAAMASVETTQKDSPGGAHAQHPKEKKESLRESLESNLIGEAKLPKSLSNPDYSPTPEASATSPAPAEPPEPETPKTSNQTVNFDLSGVPDIMRDVAEHLLLKTGRTYITDNECRVIREILDKQHTPARVMKEIRKAYKRFMKDPNKNIRQLTFNYIGECLRNQESRKPRTTPRASNVEISQNAPEITNAQEVLPDISSEIMPIDEAERVISEYTNSAGDHVVTTLQSILDSLMPSIVPLLMTFACMALLKRGMNPLLVIVGLFALGIVGYAIGLFA